MKIKVKYVRPNPTMAKQLLGIYYNLKIKILDIENVSDGFILWIDDLKEGEKIFDERNLRAANNAEFFPILPKEITCQRTLFVKVNRFILSHSIDEIINELRACNRDLKILEATKIDKSNYLKLSVDHSNTADIIMNQGIGMFSLHTPGSSISKQKYFDVIKCLNCFQYNNHSTSSCTKPKALRCTICLGPHLYKDCQVSLTEAVCFHCKENHHTFAFACKIRKNFVQQLKKQFEPKLYSNILRDNAIFERRPSAMRSDPPVQRAPLLPTPPLPPWTLNSHPPQFPPDTSVPPPPPPPFPLNPATANLMISVMSKTTAVVQLAIHSASTKQIPFVKTYEELCKSNNLPILNLENFKLFESPITIQPKSQDGNAHIPTEDIENTPIPTEDLENTSFLSADSESLANKTYISQIPRNICSSPVATTVNNENPQLDTSPISPIVKIGGRMSVDVRNAPNTMPSCSSSASGLVLPDAPSSPPTMMPAKDAATKMTANDAATKMTSSSAQPDVLLPPPKTIPSDATSPPLIPPHPVIDPLTPQIPKTPDSTPPSLRSPFPRNEPLNPLLPNIPQAQGKNFESDNGHQAETNDELRLFTTKRTRIGNRPQLKKWHQEGNLAIKRNGKIIKDEKEIELVLYNRFDSLVESREIVDNKELSQIINNCI